MKRRSPTNLRTAQSLNKVQREELARLRGEAEKKDSQIKALAGALEWVRNATVAEMEDDGGETILHALRLAGRL